jgi:hypothetical protein
MLYNGPNHTSHMPNQVNKSKVWLVCYLKTPPLGIERGMGCLNYVYKKWVFIYLFSKTY